MSLPVAVKRSATVLLGHYLGPSEWRPQVASWLMPSSFFEPLPPPPKAERIWEPPVWDRPSEGVLPWVYPVNAVVHRSGDAVIAIDHLSVYPNGFEIHVTALLDPHRRHDVALMRDPGGPRFGVRFANGQTSGRGVTGIRDIPKDAQGVPTEPFVGGGSGGGGSRHGWRFSVWVYPLPPDGPMEVFLSASVVGMEEGSAILDGSAIRAAAQKAHVIWT